MSTELTFSGDFQGQEGVRIMHQCALCNPNDFTKNKYCRQKVNTMMDLLWAHN